VRRFRSYAPGAAAVIALFAVYWPTLVELAKDWLRDENYHHGFMVPFVSVYFLLKARQELQQTPPSPSRLGLLGILLSVGLFIFGVAGAEVFTQRVSFVMLPASLVLFLWGWRHLRLLAFPIAFMLLAIPLPYVIYYGLTAPMQAFAARIAVWGLQVVGVQSVVRGNIIFLPEVSLEVAEACSGIRSLYAFLAAGALAAYSIPVPWWGRALVFVSCIPLSIAGNALRVWGSGIGAWVIGPEVTRGSAHEFFGLFVFVFSLIGILLIRKLARRLWSSDPSSPSSSSPLLERMPPRSGTANPRSGDSPRSTGSPAP
jgi:exosortase